MQPIAHFRSAFPTKFGIPRQSGIVDELSGSIIFEPEYRNIDALRGLDGFDYLWIIWEFSANKSKEERGATSWQPTVRPPLLGGNTQMGVFATRSPYRPNPIGLSSVRIKQIEMSDTEGPIIHVCGADLMDGTPIYDIKPYIPYADSLPEATGGFTETPRTMLDVQLDCPLPRAATQKWALAMREVLAQDPRPAYQDDPQRIYHIILKPFEVSFLVHDGVARVQKICPEPV